MVNKELHVDPLKSASYFKKGKYLNDVRLVYSNSESESDLNACNSVLSQGFQTSDRFESHQFEKTLPGWKQQVELERAQAWTLNVVEKDINFIADCGQKREGIDE